MRSGNRKYRDFFHWCPVTGKGTTARNRNTGHWTLKHKKSFVFFKGGQTIEWVAQQKVVKIVKTQLKKILSKLLMLTLL